jgi:hypothetical protein
MAVHPVSLSLVSQETGGGGELLATAQGVVATVGFDMGIHVFAKGFPGI